MTRDPIHPGETLREDLDAIGMSAAELARRIEVPVNCVTEILNGRSAVTADTALRLGRFFGTSGEFWAQPPEPLRAAACGAERMAPRLHACLRWTTATSCGLQGEVPPVPRGHGHQRRPTCCLGATCSRSAPRVARVLTVHPM